MRRGGDRGEALQAWVGCDFDLATDCGESGAQGKRDRAIA
jgi:hypothetical protein